MKLDEGALRAATDKLIAMRSAAVIYGPDKYAEGVIVAYLTALSAQGYVIVPREELECVRDDLLGASVADRLQKMDSFIATADQRICAMIAASPLAQEEG